MGDASSAPAIDADSSPPPTDDTVGDDSSGEPLPPADPGTGAGTDGDMDHCVDVCEPYQSCHEGVHRRCMYGCRDVLPTLAALDASCGAAADGFFVCIYSMTCEQTIADHEGELHPHPCEEDFAVYRDTCISIMPQRCHDYCDAALACAVTEEDTDGEPQDQGSEVTRFERCAFECLLLFGGKALHQTSACDDAVDRYVSCRIDATCEQLEGGACDGASTMVGTRCR